MEEDPTTRELREQQAAREGEERDVADEADTDEGTAQHERRAEKAEYLKEKLEERSEAEREARAEPDRHRVHGTVAIAT